ncbi:Alpha/Beta hydrolase protein [Rhodocollybia butyracea]|uniref:Alpha/Beta hydrolase protein n=1 Tax=Rhodocollybia butyracea TaxID=206335 RepID=A0A9P5PKE7_9AGAR|nr:Alpha/Beta hydrolase protein [Rhodocollybia butyracea]
MSSFNKDTYLVGGFPVWVYSSATSEPSSKPLFILFFLHGRGGKADDLEPNIKIIFENIASSAKVLDKDLLVVTLDHRNHGGRLIDEKANFGWDEDETKSNPRHAIDMYAIQEGSMRDVSFLIDYLPAYLFPESERKISGWGLAGVSLGGHSTWESLTKEPRITVGVPIIGCPDYLKLMSGRAAKYGISVDESGNKYFPKSLLRVIKERGALSTPYFVEDSSNPFYGKRILILSGAEDPLVPWSASQSFVEKLRVGPAGIKKVVVQPDTGHKFSPEMVVEMSVWLRDVILQ